MGKFLAISVYLLTLLLPINTQAQSAAAKFAGMWSDPPDTPGVYFVFSPAPTMRSKCWDGCWMIRPTMIVPMVRSPPNPTGWQGKTY